MLRRPNSPKRNLRPRQGVVGEWLTPLQVCQSSSTSSMLRNRTVFAPVKILDTVKIRRVGFYATLAGDPSSTVEIACYTSHRPKVVAGALHANGPAGKIPIGSVAYDVGGQRWVVWDQVLKPDLYWFALATTSSIGSVRSYEILDGDLQMVNANANPIYGWQVGGTTLADTYAADALSFVSVGLGSVSLMTFDMELI